MINVVYRGHRGWWSLALVALSITLTACDEELGDTRVSCACVCRACTIEDRRRDDNQCTGHPAQLPPVAVCATSPVNTSAVCEEACGDVAGYQVSVCFGETCPGAFPVWVTRPEVCTWLGPATVEEGACGDTGQKSVPTRDAAFSLVASDTSSAQLARGDTVASFTPMGTVALVGTSCANSPCPVFLQNIQLTSTQPFKLGDATVSELGIINTLTVQGSLAADGSIQFFAPPAFDASARINGTHVSQRAQPTSLQGQLLPNGTVRLMGQIALADGSATFDLRTRIFDSAPVVRINAPARGECGVPVHLSAAESFDPDGDAIVSYAWAKESLEGVPQPLGSGAELDVKLPVGNHLLSVTVTDARGRAMTSFVAVPVSDTLPPIIHETTVTQACLWPPNHSLAAFALGNEVLTSVEDACDGSPDVTFEAVASSQPADDTGDGMTDVDAAITDNGQALCLRAERQGQERDGRTYRATVLATDTSGNAARGQIAIQVAHDQRPSTHCPPLEPRSCDLSPPAVSPPSQPEPQPGDSAARGGCQAAGGSGLGLALLAALAAVGRGGRRRSPRAEGFVRSVLASVALLLLPGCNGSEGGDPSTQPQALSECLQGWWTTTPGSCRIEPACENPGSEGLRAACAASDCVSVTFTGYAPQRDGTAAFHQGKAIGSQSQRQFCTSGVFSGTWRPVSVDAIAVKYGGSEQQVSATCSTSTANIGGLDRRRTSRELTTALDARALSSDWTPCAY
jgi:hypothetical protein